MYVQFSRHRIVFFKLVNREKNKIQYYFSLNRINCCVPILNKIIFKNSTKNMYYMSWQQRIFFFKKLINGFLLIFFKTCTTIVFVKSVLSMQSLIKVTPCSALCAYGNLLTETDLSCVKWSNIK